MPSLQTLAANWAYALETVVPKDSTPEQVRQFKRFFYLGASSYAHLLAPVAGLPAEQALPRLDWITDGIADELRAYEKSVSEGRE